MDGRKLQESSHVLSLLAHVWKVDDGVLEWNGIPTFRSYTLNNMHQFQVIEH